MQIEVGKCYRTRDGQRVYVVATDCPHEAYPVVGWCNDGMVLTWYADGTFMTGGTPFDLVAEWSEPAPKVRRAQYLWLNSEGRPQQTVEYFKSADELRDAMGDPALQVMRVDSTEREFDT